MFIVRLIPRHHHRFSFSQPGSSSFSRSWLFSLMLIFDMSVESWIAEISFAADTDVVTFHRVVSGPSFPPGNELFLTFERTLLWVVHLVNSDLIIEAKCISLSLSLNFHKMILQSLLVQITANLRKFLSCIDVWL